MARIVQSYPEFPELASRSAHATRFSPKKGKRNAMLPPTTITEEIFCAYLKCKYKAYPRRASTTAAAFTLFGSNVAA